MQGIITDIHRCSTVDGPGLRTTVFVKGCPLKCIWCHNPETQSKSVQASFDASKASADDYANLGFASAQASSADVLERVNRLGIEHCANQCTSGALSTYGRTTTVEAIMSEVLKDRDYYANSGGGITLSGGEPMAQPEFTLELLRCAREEGIHTVLDTTGFMKSEHCRATLPVTDLYLFDYKATGEALHQKLTGVALQPILDTLNYLAENGANILLRCPIIPGVNDSPEHLQAIVDLQQRYPQSIQAIDILTWHTMGQAKYPRLGRAVPELPKTNANESQKTAYRTFFEKSGAQQVTVK